MIKETKVCDGCDAEIPHGAFVFTAWLRYAELIASTRLDYCTACVPPKIATKVEEDAAAQAKRETEHQRTLGRRIRDAIMRWLP